MTTPDPLARCPDCGAWWEDGQPCDDDCPRGGSCPTCGGTMDDHIKPCTNDPNYDGPGNAYYEDDD